MFTFPKCQTILKDFDFFGHLEVAQQAVRIIFALQFKHPADVLHKR